MISFRQIISTANQRVLNATQPGNGSKFYVHDKNGRKLLPGYTFNDSGVTVNEKTALAHMGWLACIRLLAGSIATQPKHTFRRTEGRNKVIDREHPVQRLISKKPNQFQNAFQFYYTLVTTLLNWGNFYAYISRNQFYEPVALIPIKPNKVTPKLENFRKVFYYNNKRYTNNDFIHIFNLSLNGIEGINPIKFAAQSIGLGLAGEKMQSSYFGKGLHAGGIIKLPDDLKGMMGSTEEEADEYMQALRESFKKMYQSGSETWHRMMFLEPGWDFEQFQLNFETAKIIETRKMSIADIARINGVPLHKLMELDKATFNNVEQLNIQYTQDGVMPITKNIETEFDAKLLKESEQETHFTRFNLDGLMRGDIKTRFEAYATALGSTGPGFMSPEEIRDKEDLGEIESEDLWVPMNMNRQNEEPEAA